MDLPQHWPPPQHRFVTSSIHPTAFVHPSAIVDEGAVLHEGCSVALLPRDVEAIVGEGSCFGQKHLCRPWRGPGQKREGAEQRQPVRGSTVEDDVFLGPPACSRTSGNPEVPSTDAEHTKPRLSSAGPPSGPTPPFAVVSPLARIPLWPRALWSPKTFLTTLWSWACRPNMRAGCPPTASNWPSMHKAGPPAQNRANLTN